MSQEVRAEQKSEEGPMKIGGGLRGGKCGYLTDRKMRKEVEDGVRDGRES